MRTVLLMGCLALTLATGWAADTSDIDAVLAEQAATETQAEQAYLAAAAELRAEADADIAESRADAVRALERIVSRAQRSGDTAVVAAGWRGVLAMDRDHAEAREFFTALGQLDAVIAELDAEASTAATPTDMMGNPVPQAQVDLSDPAVVAGLLDAQGLSVLGSEPGSSPRQFTNGTPFTASGFGRAVDVPEAFSGRNILPMVDEQPMAIGVRARTSNMCLVLVVSHFGHATRRALEADGWTRVDVNMRASLGRRTQSVTVYAIVVDGSEITVQTQGWAALIY